MGTNSETLAAKGLAPENLRSRYAVLVQLNLGLASDLLPLTDFRAAASYPGSTAAAISKARGTRLIKNPLIL